jgi:hypothetical protein
MLGDNTVETENTERERADYFLFNPKSESPSPICHNRAYIRCFFKFHLKVGVEESIVNAPLV